MCSNYVAVTRAGRLLSFFGVEAAQEGGETHAEVYPLGLAPFIRLAPAGGESARRALVAETGMFGLLPSFAAEMQYGRRTYNARSETVAKLPSFRQAWAAGQRCIIPAEAVFEPNWETGKAVRWRIAQVGDVPMGIAGIYRRWKNPEGGELFTFAMLTCNADGHPVFSRMHRPDDEKRMVVILPPGDYMDWLDCDLAEAPGYFRQWQGQLVAEPAPRVRVAPAAKDPRSGELF